MSQDTAITLLPEMSMIQTLLLTGAVGLFFVWFLKKRPNLPPGPRPLPLLGNLLQFQGKPLAAKISEWHQIYGPIITLYLGPSAAVVLNTLEGVNQAYVSQEWEFSDKSVSTSLDYASGGGVDIAFAPYNKRTIAKRKLAMKALRSYVTGNEHAERVDGIVRMVVKNILEEMHNGVNKTNVVELSKHTNFAMFNIMNSMCFGYTMDMNSNEFMNIMGAFQRTSGQFTGFWEDFFPFLANFPTRRYQSYMKDFDTFHGHIYKHFDKERTAFDESDDSHNLVRNFLVAEREDASNKNFTDKNMPFVMTDLFFGGIDTSRHALDWLFLNLAHKLDMQAKIHEEIDCAVGSTAIPGREHRPGLIYTEAVIQETLRLYPPLPLALPRETPKDTELQGFHIPKGTAVFANVHAIHRDPKLWEDPHEFKPERFISMDENGERCLKRHSGFIPFNVGPRSCIGESVARQSLLFLTVGLLQKLEVCLKPGVVADFEPDAKNWFFLGNKPYEVVVTVRGK